MSKTQSLTVYHYPNCGTCREAIKWLKEQGHELELHHIVETPPTAAQLGEYVRLSGLPIAKWFNVSGDAYKKLELKDKLPGMTDDEKLELLASNGMLIKRPVVTDGSRATVGFRDDMKAAWQAG